MRKPADEQLPGWRVGRDPRGQLAVFDEDGEQILSVVCSDPIRALEVAYEAGAARALKVSVAPLVKRLERIEVDHGIAIMSRDERRIGVAWLALHDSSPPAAEYEAVWASRNQLEVVWNHVA